MYIDTHAHLNSPEFGQDITPFLARAREVGVEKIIIVGWDENSSIRAVELAHTHTQIYAAVGFHPENLNELAEDAFARIKRLAQDPKVVAIGEIGLDYYWSKDEDSREKQRRYFIRQIMLANELKKPIIVHSRDAMADTYQLLSENIPIKHGVMHCYSGSAPMALKFIDLGLYISLGGPVTFKNARTPKEVAEIVPLKNLLIETDCPYLTPHPYRGKQNECSYLPLVAEAVAAIKNLDPEDIGEWTSRNAVHLFGLRDA